MSPILFAFFVECASLLKQGPTLTTIATAITSSVSFTFLAAGGVRELGVRFEARRRTVKLHMIWTNEKLALELC